MGPSRAQGIQTTAYQSWCICLDNEEVQYCRNFIQFECPIQILNQQVTDMGVQIYFVSSKEK